MLRPRGRRPGLGRGGVRPRRPSTGRRQRRPSIAHPPRRSAGCRGVEALPPRCPRRRRSGPHRRWRRCRRTIARRRRGTRMSRPRAPPRRRATAHRTPCGSRRRSPGPLPQHPPTTMREPLRKARLTPRRRRRSRQERASRRAGASRGRETGQAGDERRAYPRHSLEVVDGDEWSVRRAVRDDALGKDRADPR